MRKPTPRQNERHHYVPKSYLKHWSVGTTKDSKILIEYVKKPGETVFARPSQVAFEKGLYDLGKRSAIGKAGGLDFVEKELFANRLETNMVQMMPSFRPPDYRASNSDVEQMVFLALQFWARNPRCIQAAIDRSMPHGGIDKMFPGYADTKGDIAMLGGMLASKHITRGMDVAVFFNPESRRFMTSDVPCTPYLLNGGQPFIPKSTGDFPDNFSELPGGYIFPVNPTCLLEIRPTETGRVDVRRGYCDEDGIAMLNGLIVDSARHFFVHALR